MNKLCRLYKRMNKLSTLFYLTCILNFHHEKYIIENKDIFRRISLHVKESNSKMLEQLSSHYNTRCVVICDSTDVILEHYHMPKNKLVFISYPQNSIITKIIDPANVKVECERYSNNSFFIFIDSNCYRLYNENVGETRTCYYMPQFLENFFFKEKAVAINEIVDLLSEKFCLYNSKDLLKVGIYINQCINTYTLHIKSFPYDNLCFSYTYFKNNNIRTISAYTREIYTSMEEMVAKEVGKLMYRPTKLNFMNDLIISAFDVLGKYHIMKKAINIELYPEIVSIIFPGIFVDTGYNYFVLNEVIRFCFSCKGLAEFYEYDEYFNDKNVQTLLNEMPKMYLSYVLQ